MLAEAYPSVDTSSPAFAAIEERYAQIKAAYATQYPGNTPEVFGRAPGRVNIIGEHIDYSGYGVLPMALLFDAVVAGGEITSSSPSASPSSTTTSSSSASGNTDANVLTIRVASTRGESEYPACEIKVDLTKGKGALVIDKDAHAWSNYFLAGWRGILEDVQDHVETSSGAGSIVSLLGGKTMGYVVDGNVPIGSGLSSSSALVCAATTVALHALAPLAPEYSLGRVAEIAAAAEQWTGVEGGGMDQAASLMAVQNAALHVMFNPVEAVPVPLPPNAVFVVLHSQVAANKYYSAYNMRVVETRVAAALVASAMGIDFRSIQSSKGRPFVLADLAEAAEFDDLVEACIAVEEHLRPEPYSIQDACAGLGLGATDDFLAEFAANGALEGKPVDDPVLHLKSRAMHVYTEAGRVHDFVHLASSLSGGMRPDDVLNLLGSLMDASHASCDKFFDCSCPELNHLVSRAKVFGARGARLTGAGWGGAAVALVDVDQVDAFVSAMAGDCYDRGVDELAELGLLFASAPSRGACVVGSAASPASAASEASPASPASEASAAS